jgi:hypothetical protein
VDETVTNEPLRRPIRRWRWVAFLVVSVVASVGYWWHADWWVYVNSVEGMIPKFTLPWWWQVAESGAVGTAAGGLVVGAAHLWQFFNRKQREAPLDRANSTERWK